jgi:hypothetical protein
MFYVLQNESTAALRRVPILLTDAATGTTAQTGVALGDIYPYVNINGNAFIGGTGNVAEAGYGQYYYEFDANEIATLGLAGIHITAAGCRDYDAIAQVAAFNLYGAAGAGISAGDVWTYDISAISSAGTAGSQLNLSASGGGAGLTVGDVSDAVWNAATSSYTTSGTYGLNTLRSDVAGVAGTVSLWTGGAYSGIYADTYRIDEDYNAAIALKDILTGIGSSITANITGNITGDLSGSVGSVTADVSVSTASMAGVANTVWSTLTAPYTTHATFGHQILRSDNAATIGEVTLHQSGGSKRVDADVHAFVNNTASATAMLNILTGIGSSMTTNITGNITGNLSGSVGSVTAGVSVSTASMTGIAGTVWSTNISAYTSPSAGYSLYNASAGGGITAGDVANAVWTAQVATYATAGSNETLGTDTYGQKIARTVVINRPLSVNTANGVVVASFSSGAINAAAIASNAITEAKFATDAITSRVIASDAITSAELAPSANTEIADAVWAYATRNITGGTITTNNDKTGYSLSGSQTFDVIGNITGNLSGSVGSVTTVSNGAISAASFLAGAIDATAVASDAVTEIANGVWSVGTRTITGGTITTNSDKTGYSLSGTQTFNLTGNITGNLSGTVGSVTGAVGSVTGNIGGNVAGSVASVSGNIGGNVAGSVASVTNPVVISTATQSSIANSVWLTDVSGFASPSAGYSLAVAGSGGVSAADVWNYNGGRTITGGTVGSVSGDVTVSTTSMSAIAGTTWNYVSRTLTSAAGATAGDIWSYAGGRTITGGTANTVTNPIDVTTSSMTGIAGTVWSVGSRTITGGTITTNSDKTGYSLSSTQTFDLTGNIAGNVSGSVGSVTNPVSVSTTSMSGIANSVWSRNITSATSPSAGFELNTIYSGGTGLTAGDVWTYNTRTLTSSGTATNIINGPYFVKSNVDGQDGTLDVIRGMVQDIQLTVTDANGNPFDTSALGLSVNYYDQAGTLVTSYATTELYGPAGLVLFTLNTAVTGNEGRYNLILSAAGSGNTIKFGPLQTLVRPF